MDGPRPIPGPRGGADAFGADMMPVPISMLRIFWLGTILSAVIPPTAHAWMRAVAVVVVVNAKEMVVEKGYELHPSM